VTSVQKCAYDVRCEEGNVRILTVLSLLVYFISKCGLVGTNHAKTQYGRLYINGRICGGSRFCGA
jgi:hypothetical protein